MNTEHLFSVQWCMGRCLDILEVYIYLNSEDVKVQERKAQVQSNSTCAV